MATTSSDAAGWRVKLERGPDWLFVRLERDTDRARTAVSAGLAEAIWGMISENHAHRVVLELDRVGPVDDGLLEAIGDVGERVRAAGGLIRACGLTGPDLGRLKSSPGGPPHFDNRLEAVGGPRGGGCTP